MDAATPFKEVNGRGIEKLRAAGIVVETGLLEKECIELNKRFFCFHKNHRPYIILKWAQSADGKIGGTGKERVLISNEYSNRLVHKWRSEEAAILIGTNTALQDNPALTVRLWKGRNPIRLVLDKTLRLPENLRLFDNEAATIVFNQQLNRNENGVIHYQIDREKNFTHELATAAFRLNILSILVEGGARVLQSFIDEGIWDEARIITNEQIQINAGIPSPQLKQAKKAIPCSYFLTGSASSKKPDP